MGLFDAMTAAVSGLQSQAFAIQNISGNIANSQTVAYKGIGTSFQDLIPSASVPALQQAGGVIANSVATNTVQGTIQSETVGTYMAINGEGFFQVTAPSAFNGATPVFGGVVSYTRRGDFQLNANGNLVNGAGYYLKAFRSIRPPATRSAMSRRRCNSPTTSCRRAPPAPFRTGSTCRPFRRRRPTARRFRIPNCSR